MGKMFGSGSKKEFATTMTPTTTTAPVVSKMKRNKSADRLAILESAIDSAYLEDDVAAKVAEWKKTAKKPSKADADAHKLSWRKAATPPQSRLKRVDSATRLAALETAMNEVLDKAEGDHPAAEANSSFRRVSSQTFLVGMSQRSTSTTSSGSIRRSGSSSSLFDLGQDDFTDSSRSRSASRGFLSPQEQKDLDDYQQRNYDHDFIVDSKLVAN